MNRPGSSLDAALTSGSTLARWGVRSWLLVGFLAAASAVLLLLAQVSGFRGETRTRDSVEGRVAADLDYVRNWSLWLDTKIIARTFMAVVSGRNAY